ncbi:hypothetical protein HWI79_1165 [Cryptosporidium felis]|nr:hypothetical protein HWI79_1165 [Cryptosporidium felis]
MTLESTWGPMYKKISFPFSRIYIPSESTLSPEQAMELLIQNLESGAVLSGTEEGWQPAPLGSLWNESW